LPDNFGLRSPHRAVFLASLPPVAHHSYSLCASDNLSRLVEW
jgi:hypothetical protein